MSAILRAFTNVFLLDKPDDQEGPLTRMFRIEYANEYKHLRRHGGPINDGTVKSFLKDMKNH